MLMQLQAQVQQLQQQLSTQQAAAASTSTNRSGSPPHGSGPRPKIREPSLYAGDPQKIDGWMQELQQHAAGGAEGLEDIFLKLTGENAARVLVEVLDA